MRHPRLRTLQLGFGFLLWVVAGFGLWLGWAGQVVSSLMIAAGLVVHGPRLVTAWRERGSKPAEPAERVLRHYPNWW
ncbi:hypothetical protein C1I95_05845 [Micromonospora craterilacus]|uniref:Uncharacterized protein n=1 Tax=Micromonospora craterilacus TaxID=1655439 RepID=A0A2W2EZ53_9ACTN|nr:hypothetical protein C1I95_05845 [Micromonospora craterilacus]